ncbi:MAG: restriction endonuclease subunit S [Candidatus Poribacteria bacterium]|nr:restriction endonuclease subunit S [Candidatus Poribacteria bacterium]
MRRYPEYKESGLEWIGEIPSHWKKSRLKYESLVPVQYGLNINSDLYAEQGIRFIRTTDITENGELIDKGVYLETGSVEKIYLTQPNDFLISRSGTLGRTYLHQSETKHTYGGYLVRFNFGCSIKSRFIFYFTKSRCFEHWITLNTIQSTIGNVNGQKYSNLEIFLPSLTEQTQIANFLDRKTEQIDELIHIKERRIELLQEQRTALINQAVTKGLDPNVEMKPSSVEWIGEIPKDWDTVPLTKYLESIIDYRGRTPEKTEDGRFLVTAKNIRDGQIDYEISQEFTPEDEYQRLMTRGRPKIGDVLFTTEAPLGEVANVDDVSIALAQRIIKFRPKSDFLNPYFLKYWILSYSFQSDLQRYATGSTAQGIKASKLCLLKLNLPPLKEQKQIVDYLDQKAEQTNKLISEERRKIELLKEYRQSLISEAVTGKIDVRNEV